MIQDLMVIILVERNSKATTIAGYATGLNNDEDHSSYLRDMH
jgi:hypothetical protein